MAKKKLLNEAQVRRFMGLAGLKPISRAVISEMSAQYEADDAPADEEGEVDDAEMAEPVAEPAMDAPAEGGADVDPSQIEAAVAALQDLEALLQPLADAAGIDMEAGAAMDDEEMPPMGDEEMPPMGDEEMPPMGDEAGEESAELAPEEDAELAKQELWEERERKRKGEEADRMLREEEEIVEEEHPHEYAVGDPEEEASAWRSEKTNMPSDPEVLKRSRLRRLWMLNKFSF